VEIEVQKNSVGSFRFTAVVRALRRERGVVVEAPEALFPGTPWRSRMTPHGRFSGWFATLLICCSLVFPAFPFAATVTTAKPDCPPGSTVSLCGAGWQSGETVQLTLLEEPTRSFDVPLTPTADGLGNISASYTIEVFDLGVVYTITAVGQSSGLTATTTFT